MKKLFISIIISVFLIIFLLFITGVIMLTMEFLHKPTVSERLMIDCDDEAVEKVHEWDNGASFLLWVKLRKIYEKELLKCEYHGKIAKVDGKAYWLDDGKMYPEIISPCSDPEWFKLEKGYSVYKVKKGDRHTFPFVICTIFISPDKKDIYIYQDTSLRD